MDFTDSSSGLATPAQQDEDDSGASASTPVTFDPYKTYNFGGRQIPGADAQLVYDYGQAYGSERQSYIQDNFDLARYYKANGMEGDAQRVEQLSPEQLQLERGSVIDGINNLMNDDVNSGYIELGKGLEGAPDQGEYNQINSLLAGGARRSLYSGYGRDGELFGGFTSDTDPLGLYAAEDPRDSMSLEEKEDDFADRLGDWHKRNLGNKTFSYVNSQVEPIASQKYTQSFGRELNIDERRSIEQNLYRNYNIAADLTGEGYVNESGRGWLGVTDVFGPGFQRSTLKAWDGIATAVENVLGGDEEDQAYRQQKIKEIGQEMAVATKSLEQKVAERDIEGYFTDTLGQFGASLPMMGAAMITGAVTRSPRASMAAVSTFGAATIYSENKDNEWFQNLSSAEQVGFVASSGIAEGVPAMVAANIFAGGGLAGAVAKRLVVE